MTDLRFAVRTLARRPASAVVAVLTLTLGLGAATALFSVLHAVLIRPLPFNEPDRLVAIAETSPRMDEMAVAYPNFEDWRARSHSFSAMAAHVLEPVNLTGRELPERLLATRVSASLFPMLGVVPTAGRFFTEDEDRTGARPVVVISHRLERSLFGAERSSVGASLTLDGIAYTVIGVTPPGFFYPLAGWQGQLTDIYLTVASSTDTWRTSRGEHPGMEVTARLRNGISLSAARDELVAVARQIEREHPDTNADQSVRLQWLKDQQVREVRPALLLLAAAVGLVLLVACANVANLLLASSFDRAAEMAMRSALGASPGRLVRQLLTESLVLSFLGGIGGVLLASAGTAGMRRLLPATLAAHYGEIEVNGTVLGFAIGLAALTAVVFGLAPALQIARSNAASALKFGRGGQAVAAGPLRLRNALVVAEVTLAVVVLCCASLVLRSFAKVVAASPGFEPEGVLAMDLSLSSLTYRRAADRAELYKRLEERLTGLPGVSSSALGFPLLGGWQNAYMTEGDTASVPGETPRLTEILSVSPGYFRTLRIPLIRGRTFAPGDVRGAPAVAIVDETFAEASWPGENPLGRRVKMGTDPRSSGPWLEVVGVVGHVKSYGVDAPSRVQLYRPIQQWPLSYAVVLLRTDHAAETVASSVRRAVMAIDPDQPISSVGALEAHLDGLMLPRRTLTILLGIFAGIVMILAAAGIWAFIAFTVSRRTREIGVMMALGASTRDILNATVGRCLRLAAVGIGVGLAASLAVTPLLSSFLFRIGSHDALSLAGAIVVLTLLAAVAAFLPARRALGLDPVRTLRSE